MSDKPTYEELETERKSAEKGLLAPAVHGFTSFLFSCTCLTSEFRALTVRTEAKWHHTSKMHSSNGRTF